MNMQNAAMVNFWWQEGEEQFFLRPLLYVSPVPKSRKKSRRKEREPQSEAWRAHLKRVGRPPVLTPSCVTPEVIGGTALGEKGPL